MTMQVEPVSNRHRARVVAGYAGGLLLGAVVWQAIGSAAPSEVFVPLTTTVVRFAQVLADGTLLSALATSFGSYFVGMAFALVIGGFGGVLLARRRLLRTAFEPWIVAVYATPMVGLIPFLLALLGFGFWPKVIVIILFAVFPVLLNTQRGAQSIAPELLDVARCYRSSERDTWIHVVIPCTLPFFMTGVRQSLARGLVGVIASDFFLSADGLGGLLVQASERFDTAEVLAITLLITAIGLILMAVGRGLETRFARWRVGA